MKRRLSPLIGLWLCASANAVTFNVTVPDGTKACYISGQFNNWSATEAVEMQQAGSNKFTLTLEELTTADVADGFKYLSGPDWKYVEKGASGEEISNRTQATDNDVVGSWAQLYNPDIIETTITVNGYDRKVRISLPSDYKTSEGSYPVVYFTGVQQRYSDAGSDDGGDDFFGENSWNTVNAAALLQQQGVPGCIMVAMYSFVAENIPYPTDMFIGSGQSETFLDDFIATVKPYVESNYRALTGVENTSIVGADLGGLFSIYATLTRPDVFGRCVSMSPMLWVNQDEISALASKAKIDSQRFLLSYGDGETAVIKTAVDQMAQTLNATKTGSASVTQFANAIHDDTSWGKSFPTVYPFLTQEGYIPADNVTLSTVTRNVISAPETSSSQYLLFTAIDSEDVIPDETAKFIRTENYMSKEGAAQTADVTVKVIPAEVKTKYYWNVGRADDGDSYEYLLSAPKSVSFSSKKTADSWHRVAVLADETIENIAASSAAFRVYTSAGSTSMTVKEDYTTEATVSFTYDNRTFEIHYGSVNSGSDMGAITATQTVPEGCTEAIITYDFLSNTVTVRNAQTALQQYALFTAIDTQDVVLDETVQFAQIDNYTSKTGDIQSVQALVKDIPVDVTTQYYWNVGRADDDSYEFLLASPKSVSFKSSKSAVSWHRVAVLADETIENVAASSEAFRLSTSAGDITMSTNGNHTVKATAQFLGEDKTFDIHYGSVNSGSDMGAITATQSVSDDCTEAIITYDFLSNTVAIEETKHGESIGNVVIENFSVVPAITYAGNQSQLTLKFAEGSNCEASLSMSYNYGTPSAVTLTAAEDGSYKGVIDLPKEGLYTLSVNFVRGETVKENAASICIRALAQASTDKQQKVTVNAYADIDWNTTERYKANFHTHTSQSFDCSFTTSQVVDLYHEADYKILALTDHDTNPYPWTMFDLFNPQAESRDPEALGMLAIPGVELSKDNRNSWEEQTGGYFNHHNDFFTGRKGQEFASLRESYAYTQALGGMQIINHPGQYWSLDNEYTPGEKNSPEWHAENFTMFSSLIGLEVYNQGNRRPNDRILWDQILEITMPERPVWGYSCDDTHTREQFFRNYQFMLMPELTVDALKDAMRGGCEYFSYEYTGSGEAKAPRIESISVDEDAHRITIDTEATEIYWISGTDKAASAAAKTRKSTVVGMGKEFDFTDFQGTYVRALIKNEWGETCTQPFGFGDSTLSVEDITSPPTVIIYPNPTNDIVNIRATDEIRRVEIVSLPGVRMMQLPGGNGETLQADVSSLAKGTYLTIVTTETKTTAHKLIIK